MPYDFPSSAVNGQQVTGSGGQVYTFDGTKWKATGAATTGTVTNVATGAGLTGGPITTTGTIALSAPVSVANGGTGATTAGAALTSLGAAPLASPTFTGTVTIPAGASISGYAPLASPTFTGTPSLPTGTTGITQAAGTSNTTLATTAFVAPAVQAAQDNTGRNLVHNGTFVVQQRGAGAWTATGAYTADRWVQWLGTGDTINTVINPMSDAIRAQIGSEAANSTLYSTFTGSANAAGLVLVQQKIEGVRRLSGKTVAVSFWAASNSGTPKLGVGIDEDFGTGGSPSATVSTAGQTVTLSTTWTRYVLTFTLASTAGKTFGTNSDDKAVLNFFLSAGSNWNTNSGNVGVQTNGIAFWGVQLEIGSVATPLDAGGTPQAILAQCQRFYQLVTVSARFPATAIQTFDTTVTWLQMRAMPTITLVVTGSSAVLNSQNLPVTATNSGRFEIVSSGAGDCYALGYTYGLSADL